MGIYNKLLVPLDGSKLGEASLSFAKELAAKTPSSLIAMSTHGRSGVGRWVYGSVAEKVLSGTSSLILLVRPNG